MEMVMVLVVVSKSGLDAQVGPPGGPLDLTLDP